MFSQAKNQLRRVNRLGRDAAKTVSKSFLAAQWSLHRPGLLNLLQAFRAYQAWNVDRLGESTHGRSKNAASSSSPLHASQTATYHPVLTCVGRSALPADNSCLVSTFHRFPQLKVPRFLSCAMVAAQPLAKLQKRGRRDRNSAGTPQKSFWARLNARSERLGLRPPMRP